MSPYVVSGTISIVVVNWNALTTQTTAAELTLKSCAIVGSATFEIVPSSTLSTVVIATVNTTSCRRPGGSPWPYSMLSG